MKKHTGPHIDAGEGIGIAIEAITDALTIGPTVKRIIAAGGDDDAVFAAVWDEVSPKVRDLIKRAIREARD